MRVALRALAAVTPLLLTFLIAALLMEGHLNAGGGEKDILLAIPLLLWSLVFLVSSAALGWRGVALGRATAVSAGIATALVVLLWLVIFLASAPGRS